MKEAVPSMQSGNAQAGRVAAGGAGDLQSAAVSLPATEWSALAAAVAAAAVVVRTASPTFSAAAPPGPPAAVKHMSIDSGIHHQIA